MIGVTSYAKILAHKPFVQRKVDTYKFKFGFGWTVFLEVVEDGINTLHLFWAIGKQNIINPRYRIPLQFGQKQFKIFVERGLRRYLEISLKAMFKNNMFPNLYKVEAQQLAEESFPVGKQFCRFQMFDQSSKGSKSLFCFFKLCTNPLGGKSCILKPQNGIAGNKIKKSFACFYQCTILNIGHNCNMVEFVNGTLGNRVESAQGFNFVAGKFNTVRVVVGKRKHINYSAT